MAYINVLSRRDFLAQTLRAGGALGLASLVNIPPFARRALAEGTSLGTNGKKLLFIFLRGANDALNSVIPVGDTAYNNTIRPAVRSAIGATESSPRREPWVEPSPLRGSSAVP